MKDDLVEQDTLPEAAWFVHEDGTVRDRTANELDECQMVEAHNSALDELDRLREKFAAAENQLNVWRKDPTPSMKMREKNRALREKLEKARELATRLPCDACVGGPPCIGCRVQAVLREIEEDTSTTRESEPCRE